MINFGVLTLGPMNTLFVLYSLLFDLFYLNLNLYFYLNLIYLELDLSFILVLKELVYDNEKFTISLCVKKT